MDKNEERQRLINMRKCLRWVQTVLPRNFAEENMSKGSEFICANVRRSPYDLQTQQDTIRLIERAINPHLTFNVWMLVHNSNRYGFSFEELMEYRQRWIDQLCRDITKQLRK